jgi:hypothetical protein
VILFFRRDRRVFLSEFFEVFAHYADRFSVGVAAAPGFEESYDGVHYLVVGILKARVHMQRSSIFRQRNNASAILLEADVFEAATAAAREGTAQRIDRKTRYRDLGGKIQLKLESSSGKDHNWA